VLHELQKGYRVGERLLRPAIVVVRGGRHLPRRLRPVGRMNARPPAGGGDIDVTGQRRPARGGRAPSGEEEQAIVSHIIGIDLGTTNSCVAVLEGDGAPGDP